MLRGFFLAVFQSLHEPSENTYLVVRPNTLTLSRLFCEFNSLGFVRGHTTGLIPEIGPDMSLVLVRVAKSTVN